MAHRILRGVAAIALAGTLVLLVVAPSGQAGSGKCSSKGQAVITQSQLVIYVVETSGGIEYRGCYAKTGRVTRLITKGEEYLTEQVVAHGTQATVAESVPAPAGGTVRRVVTIWNLKTGKPFEALEIAPETAETGLVDDVLGDPVTAVVYVVDGKRVVDALYDKGSKRLSTASVKSRSVKVSGRRISWTEGGKKRSKKV